MQVETAYVLRLHLCRCLDCHIQSPKAWSRLCARRFRRRPVRLRCGPIDWTGWRGAGGAA